MEFIKIPLAVAIKASRENRMILKYIRLHQKGIDPEKLEELRLKESKPKETDLTSKTYDELVAIGKEAGLKNAHSMSKKSLLEQLTSDKII